MWNISRHHPLDIIYQGNNWKSIGNQHSFINKSLSKLLKILFKG